MILHKDALYIVLKPDGWKSPTFVDEYLRTGDVLRFTGKMRLAQPYGKEWGFVMVWSLEKDPSKQPLLFVCNTNILQEIVECEP